MLRELTNKEIAFVSGGDGGIDAQANYGGWSDFGAVFGGAYGAEYGGAPGGILGYYAGGYGVGAVVSAVNDPAQKDMAMIVGGMDGVNAGSATPAGSVSGNDFGDPSPADSSNDSFGGVA